MSRQVRKDDPKTDPVSGDRAKALEVIRRLAPERYDSMASRSDAYVSGYAASIEKIERDRAARRDGGARRSDDPRSDSERRTDAQLRDDALDEQAAEHRMHRDRAVEFAVSRGEDATEAGRKFDRDSAHLAESQRLARAIRERSR